MSYRDETNPEAWALLGSPLTHAYEALLSGSFYVPNRCRTSDVSFAACAADATQKVSSESENP